MFHPTCFLVFFRGEGLSLFISHEDISVSTVFPTDKLSDFIDIPLLSILRRFLCFLCQPIRIPLPAEFLMFSFSAMENVLTTCDSSPHSWNNRELNQRRRRRRGRRQVKNELIFYQRYSRLSRSVQYTNGSINVLKLNIQWRRSIPSGNTKN